MSEYGDGDGTGMTMAYQILNDLKDMQPKSWIYWQVVDNSGGWGLMGNVLSGPDSNNVVNSGYWFNEKYFVMGNFSKFIRPGYQFVGMDDSNSVAAYDGNGTLAIVTASNSSSDQQVTYNLNNLPSSMGTGPWTVTPYRTSATENLIPQPAFSISGSSFIYQIPANSVTTFQITSPAVMPLVDGGQYAIYTQWSWTNWTIVATSTCRGCRKPTGFQDRTLRLLVFNW